MQAAETDGIQGSPEALFSMSEKTPVTERYDADGASGGDCDSRYDRHGAWRRRDDAEQALSLTAQLMTDEFANALEVKNSAGTSATGELVTPLLRSGNSHLWLHFSATDWSGTGVEKWYGDYTYDDAYNKISLLTQAAISDEYYTAFDGYTYSEETACFTVQNLAIYRKKDTMGTSRKAVVKPINLTVRAVNLDQK